MLQGEEQLKRDMHAARKADPSLTLGQHYEKFARSNGFKTYAALRTDWKDGRLFYSHNIGVVIKK